MSLLSLTPNIFYADIQVGLKFFNNGIGFKTVYQEDGFYIIKRDQVVIHLMVDIERSKGDRPAIRIKTDDIEGLHNEISTRHPDILHPNGNKIKLQPWGTKEFAVLDETEVCISFYMEQPGL